MALGSTEMGGTELAPASDAGTPVGNREVNAARAPEDARSPRTTLD